MKIYILFKHFTLVFFSLFLLTTLSIFAEEGNSFAGITFRELSEEDLNVMESQTGYRIGVEVISISKDSPALGILTPNSVIMAIGKQYVDVPEAAVAALQSATGKVSIVALINENGQFSAKTVELNMNKKGTSKKSTPANTKQAIKETPMNKSATPSNTTTNQTYNSTNDLVSAYFDLLDFMRTQAWGQSSVTPVAERQRVMKVIADNWNSMDNNSRNGSIQIADTWYSLKKDWPKYDKNKQTELKEYWKKFLLLPSMVYPPLNQPKLYNSSAGSFQYPNSWTGGETFSNGFGYLFIGQGGSSSSWEKVYDSSTSPAGGLYISGDITQEMQGYSAMDGLRMYQQQYFGNAPGIKEIYSDQSAQGAIAVFKGKFPGQSEEKFFWLTLIPAGDKYVVVRMGGPVSQSSTLVPYFWNMLSSIQFAKKSSGGGSSGTGSAYSSWETAWSKVSCGVVANIWAK